MKMRRVSVIGIGSTPYGHHPDRRIEDLATEAALEALLDSGIERKRIGAVYLGNFVSGVLNGQEILAGLVADNLGLGSIPCTKVEGACASGGIAFRHAYLAVATGQCEAALVLGAEKMSHRKSSEVTAALNCAMDNASDGTAGLTFPGVFGMAWSAYAHRYGANRQDISTIVVKNKTNGLSNPLAQMKKPVTFDDILQSPLICDPLRLYDCCPVSDGASAVVISTTDIAKTLNDRIRIDVLASVQTRGSARLATQADPCSFSATIEAAQQAYATAGISSNQLDFVELHDCFSISEVIDIEDLGLVPRGQGARWSAEGNSAITGSMPINPSGGLLAKGHPVGATGVGQVYEAVCQLRGTHANQIKNARIGLTHNLGGTGVACTVNILARES